MGLLKEGDKLPSVKEAVGMITVNPNTVFKAYRELENQGLVKGQAGRGIFVLPQPATATPGTHADLTTQLANWLYTAQAAGLDDEAIEGLFMATLRNLKRR